MPHTKNILKKYKSAANESLGKVSIITPSFNQGKFLEETILSVINQTYRNIEYIIIDAGSTDETSRVVEKYSMFISIFIQEKDDGQADAINKGLSLASGEYVTWLNSDDVLMPDAIELAVSTLSTDSQCVLVYGDIMLVDENTRHLSDLKGEQVYPPSVFWNLDLGIPQQGAIWRSSILKKVGALDLRWHYVLDREFFLRICIEGKVTYKPAVLGCFRQHNNSKSISMKRSWIYELPAMYESMTSIPAWRYPKNITKIVRASSRIHAAYLALAAREYVMAFMLLAQAVKIDNLILFRFHIYFKPFNKMLKFMTDLV